MDDPRIRLTIWRVAEDRLSFILAHLHPAQITIGFRVHRKGELYSLSPISGFVDKFKTSWEIDFIDEAKN
jgi:hypothetical protein